MKPDFEGIKNKLDHGKQKLGGREYYYYSLRKEGAYIQRYYVTIANRDTALISILYREAISKSLTEEEQLRQFDKNCEAAFTVK